MRGDVRGDNVTAAQCASMFYCEWYQEKMLVESGHRRVSGDSR